MSEASIPDRGVEFAEEEQPPVVSESPLTEDQDSALPFPIVGIGASAGGLEAFTNILEQTPVDTGMAFVIISHLPVHHRSLLPQILGRTTAMPVVEITQGARPEPNTVHVIPTGFRVELREGAFRLERRPEREAQPRPIDIFFRSLGEEQKSRAIGIVLSGSDSDGALGLKSIKGEGGISIVQDETTAKFETMPRNAIAADHVDLVLAPGDIGLELGRIGRELKTCETTAAVLEHAPTDQSSLSRIHSLLKSVSGIDFSRYKQTTFRRRIARRMVVTKTQSLAEYARLLQANAAEVRELSEDVLIGVTRFFRDPEVFEVLASEIFPFLLKGQRPEESIRIWVPGCATGEEVYSIGIRLLEYLGKVSIQTPIQIFGTDASERSIEKARRAMYPETIAADVSADRLRRFFVKQDTGYQVSKRLRELCIFSRHNLTQDPPFSHLNLVSCRNVLIYLSAPAQKKIISGFHYALNTPGVLLLGQSETIREFSDLFTFKDKRNKFYVKNPGISRIHPELIATGAISGANGSALEARGEDTLTDVDLQRATDRLVVARYGPPGVVVDERLEIVQTRGDTSQFLALPSGAISLNILRMAREGLASTLRDALNRAVKEDVPVVVEGIRFQADLSSQAVTLEILPLQNGPSKRRHFLVLFIEKPGAAPSQAGASHTSPEKTADAKDREIAALREDLGSTKLYLQSMIQDRDGTNQELISANEEVQSSNEELQSINEELETAKEELQSQTEELQTVNEELRRRNEELGHTTSDLVNLLNNITMPVLILSADLHIRQVTPFAERMLSIRSTDIGRHIRDMRLNLRVGDLEPLLMEVIETLATKEIEVEDREGRWFLLRVKPYRTVENKIDGVVLVLIDIDQIRRTQQELKGAHEFARSVVDNAQVPLVVLDSELRIRTANRAFLALSQQPADKVEGRSFHEVAEAKWNLGRIVPNIRQILEHPADMGGFALEHEYDEGRRTLLINAQAIRPEGKAGVVLAMEDITVRKQAQHLLRREKERLEGRVLITEEALHRSHEELQRLTASLFTAQEEERRRIARDLHDDLSQKLAVLHMNVDRLEQRATTDPEVKKGLAEIHRAAAALLDDLRRVAHQLHPQILDDLGLAVALQRLAEEFESAEDMPVRLTLENLPESISPPVATCYYRIAQEALRNVVKHAGDTPVYITLAGSEKALRLCIRDEGVGFDTSQAHRSEGLGLVSMQERVRLLGGVLSVASEVGVGTTVEATLPLTKADEK